MRRLLWLDVETTGLDPNKDHLLEVAAAVTDEALKIVAATYWVVYYPRRVVIKDDYVFKLHTRNGLLKDITNRHEAKTLRTIDEELADWLRVYNAVDLWVAGCNPTFDRQWLARHLPTSSRLLHSHRNFEMNTIYALHDIPKQGGREHRGLDDLNQDIETARQIWKARARRPLAVRLWNGILDILSL